MRNYYPIRTYDGGLTSLWRKVEEDEFYSSCYMHMQLNYLSDYAEDFGIFQFWDVENCKSALSGQMQSPLFATFD